MKAKKIQSIIVLLLIIAMAFSISGCGGSKQPEDSGDESPSSEEPQDQENAEGPFDGKTLAVCLGSEPETLDPAFNATVDGSTMLVHLFSGLAKWNQTDSGVLEIVPDCAEALVEGTENDDGTVTYTYTLKEGLKWSDGQPVKAEDFVFAWQRASNASSNATFRYMFDVIDGYSSTDPESKLNVKAVDDRTLEVVLSSVCTYWDELLAFPAYFPIRENVASNKKWFTHPTSYVCNGPFVMSGWEHGTKITLEKNPNYHDAGNVTIDKLECYLTGDSGEMVEKYKEGQWLMIDDVPTQELRSLKDQFPEELVIKGQIGTYYLTWNVNNSLLPGSSSLKGAEAEAANAEIRKAVGLLFDRNYIADQIGQAGQVPASSFVAMGITEPDGSEFYKNANKNAGNSYLGYFDVTPNAVENNIISAVETLKKYYTYNESDGAFENFPELKYLYNTSEGHKAIGEYIQSSLAGFGIPMTLEEQEWPRYLENRKAGNYSVARNFWLADYNDPISFLEMWTSNSGNNDAQFGRGNHEGVAAYSLDLTDLGYDTKVENGAWKDTYDVLISRIKHEPDKIKRYELMHRAEDFLMDTGCITPVYFNTDVYMLNRGIDGFFSNPLGYKYFMHTKPAA